MSEIAEAIQIRDTVITATYVVRISAKVRDYGEGMGPMVGALRHRMEDILRHEMDWSENSIEPTDALRKTYEVEILADFDGVETGPSVGLTPAEVEEIDFDMV